MNFSALNKNGRSACCCSSSKEIAEVIFSQKIFLFIEMEAEVTKLNISLNFLSEVLYFSKRLTRKKFSHCATEQIGFPIFRNYRDTGVRTTDKIDSGNRGKGFERYGGNIM